MSDQAGVNKVAIFGGTGQTGMAVASSLQRLGIRSLRLSRRVVSEGSSHVEGADAAYLIAPNMHPDEPALIKNYVDLIIEAGISRVVYHSVAAPYAPAMRHHLGKAMSEDLVRRSGLAWTILQPGAYLQNFVPAPGASEIRVPFGVDARFGMVDLSDVGDAAATVLADGHVGATYELGGPMMLSIREAAAAATEVLGRTIVAVAESTDSWASRVADGMSADESAMYVAMWKYYDQYGLATGGAPLAALLNRPGNSFAQVLRRAP